MFKAIFASVLLASVAYQVPVGPYRPRTSAPATIDIRTFQFAPDTARVAVGATVRWTNQDDIEHTVTSGAATKRDHRFHAVLAKQGASYEATLREVGTYSYFCDRHQFMRGTITVTN